MIKKLQSLITSTILIILLFMVGTLLFQKHDVEADWRMDQIAEYTALDVTDATVTQHSALIIKPTNAKGLMVRAEVTAGSSLLLDYALSAYSPTEDDYTYMFWLMPTTNGITGIGTWYSVIGGYTNTAAYSANFTEFEGFLPSQLRLSMLHDNTNAATYKLYYQWIFDSR